MSSNAARFKKTVAAILGVPNDQVTDSLSAENVDSWDSLNHINLVSALEQEFGVMLPTQTMGSSQSVSSLKALLAEHGVEI